MNVENSRRRKDLLHGTGPRSCALAVLIFCVSCSGGGEGVAAPVAAKPTDSPQPTYTVLTVAQVALGSYHSCAVLSDQTLQCWGSNASGQLGNGTTLRVTIPTPVSGIWLAVAATGPGSSGGIGGGRTCGLNGTGSLFCWGYSNFGALGDGTSNSSSAPVRATTTSIFSSLAVGWNSLGAAISNSGALYRWGYVSLSTFIEVPRIDATAPAFSSIAAGPSHLCGIDSAGTAWCTGRRARGQIAGRQNNRNQATGRYRHRAALVGCGIVYTAWRVRHISYRSNGAAATGTE